MEWKSWKTWKTKTWKTWRAPSALTGVGRPWNGIWPALGGFRRLAPVIAMDFPHDRGTIGVGWPEFF